ncbi:AAA family ATPase [Fulvivirga maritima]|uniref:McrB family protein n=1 Tax=Fulvivirga maritima TaxID=2904247 RepID=UPI001F27342C|nr:AAA family ATPase [Fulvivirga maritima]UII25893.1 AAA family ATPase [Fulvivirga maritima]
MTPKDFAEKLYTFLGNLIHGKKIDSWEYVGIANVAFGTPNGAWDKSKFPGFQFRKSELSIEFILRAIPDTGNGSCYMVVESIDMGAQLANFHLNKKLKSKNGKNSLIENYSMTVGLGAKPKAKVKELFIKHGFNSEGIITQFDENLDLDLVLSDILKWATIRRQVKIEFQQGDSDVNGNMVRSMINIENSHSLNQILYGPPGTGKTYKLSSQFFPKFTESKPVETEVEKLQKIAARYSWWQIVAAVVVQLGSGRVTDILNAPLLRAKDEISNQKNPRAMIWAMLQTHTKADCKHVKYSKRAEPLFFWKNDKGMWSIDQAVVESDSPEILDILKEVNQGTQESLEIKRYSFCTFHQSMAYEDFVEGIKPKLDESGEIGYEIKDGIFKEIVAKAIKDPNHDYALFIDEINRGNVSSIFGELITLIESDKRIGQPNHLSVILPYSREEFSVPSNLHIIGTMNTADRSVEALDVALRRRFSFEHIVPQYSLPSLMESSEALGVSVSRLLETINERITYLKDEDHQIGHSYFINVLSKEELAETFNKNIIPLLKEYFYNDYGKIRLILGEEFVEKVENAPKMAVYDQDDYLPTIRYKLTDLTSDNILEKVKTIIGD